MTCFVQKYIHLKCLSTWQAQLRKQKGWKGASCCDVCKTRWKEGFVNIDRASKNSNSLLPALADRAQNFLESLHPHLLTILHGWKAIALAQGFLMGVETGMKGFRLGLRYHSMSLASKIQVGLPLSDAFSSTTQAEFSSLMKWSPLSFWAAGVFCRTVRLPTVASLVPIPIHLLSAGMLGVRGRLLALLGMYAGAIAGFYRGVASTTGVTVNLALKSPWLVSSLVKTAVRSAVHILLNIVARR